MRSVTVVAAVAFVFVERRTAEPIIPLHLFKDLNFNLSTVARLLIGVAMFGAIGYLPTYLQMAFSVNATESGLLVIPMMGALLVASVGSGQLVSRTGPYKWMAWLSFRFLERPLRRWASKRLESDVVRSVPERSVTERSC